MRYLRTTMISVLLALGSTVTADAQSPMSPTSQAERSIRGFFLEPFLVKECKRYLDGKTPSDKCECEMGCGRCNLNTGGCDHLE